jgi:hypothetical protein
LAYAVVILIGDNALAAWESPALAADQMGWSV